MMNEEKALPPFSNARDWLNQGSGGVADAGLSAVMEMGP
jgi:hypothetical protein